MHMYIYIYIYGILFSRGEIPHRRTGDSSRRSDLSKY